MHVVDFRFFLIFDIFIDERKETERVHWPLAVASTYLIRLETEDDNNTLESMTATSQSCPWVQFLQSNPTHQMTDPTQPNPSQSKNFGPTNQPNPQPITQSNSIQPTTNLLAQGKQFVTVSKSLPGINHLSRYQALLQQSQVLEFLKMFLTHNPTQPTKN